MDITMMKFGVSLSETGEVRFDQMMSKNLWRYKDLYREVAIEILGDEIRSSRYPSPEYNVYTDPEVLERLNTKLEEITKFLLSKDVFPEDLLEERENKVVKIDILLDRPRKTYLGYLSLPYIGIDCDYKTFEIPVLHRAINKLRTSLWSLKKEPWDCFLYITKTKGKRLTKNVIDEVYYGKPYKNLLHDFEENMIVKVDYKDLEKTGFSVDLDTSMLCRHSPLRYILENERDWS